MCYMIERGRKGKVSGKAICEGGMMRNGGCREGVNIGVKV